MAIWYMRDNHTFKKLDTNIEVALLEIELEFKRGYTHGMVSSHDVPGIHVHASGKDKLEDFLKDVRAYYENYSHYYMGAGI